MENLDEEAIEAAVEVPIDMAQVIAAGIVAIIGEIETHALVPAAALALDLPTEDTPRLEFHAIKPQEEVGGEEGGGLRHED